MISNIYVLVHPVEWLSVRTIRPFRGTTTLTQTFLFARLICDEGPFYFLGSFHCHDEHHLFSLTQRIFTAAQFPRALGSTRSFRVKSPHGLVGAAVQGNHGM